MQYLIFQYGWQPVLIQRILISLEAILENNLSFLKTLDFIEYKAILIYTLIDIFNSNTISHIVFALASLLLLLSLIEKL